MTETVNPNFALGIAAAVTAATEGSAYSCFADGWTSRIEARKSADLAVMDVEFEKERLLDARVMQTWYQGKVVFQGEQ